MSRGYHNKAYLEFGEYKYLKVKCKALEEKIRDLENKIHAVNSTSIVKMENDRSSNSRDKGKHLNAYVAELADLKREYSKLLHKAELTCLEIEKKVDQIENTLARNIFFLYFICDRSFEQISVDLNYQFQYVRNVFYKQLKKYNREIFDKDREIKEKN